MDIRRTYYRNSTYLLYNLLLFSDVLKLLKFICHLKIKLGYCLVWNYVNYVFQKVSEGNITIQRWNFSLKCILAVHYNGKTEDYEVCKKRCFINNTPPKIWKNTKFDPKLLNQSADMHFTKIQHRLQKDNTHIKLHKMLH